MPYKKFTKLMIKSLDYMVTCLNMSPPKNGISNDLSTYSIILGTPNTDYSRLKITFGAYEQVHIGTTNNTDKITEETISL